MDPSTILLAALAALVPSLALAGVFISRGRAWQGLLLGLAPIAIMEIMLWLSLRPRVEACIEAACAAAGLGAGCQVDTFACTEWTGLAALFFLIAGMVDLLIYLTAAAIMVLVFSRRRRASADSGGSTMDQRA